MGARSMKRYDTLDELVVALCKDFTRRERLISNPATSHRTKVELKYMNYKIGEAAREVVGDDFLAYVREIGEAIGYASSSVGEVSERTYKLKKAEVKANIAKRLHLTD